MSQSFELLINQRDIDSRVQSSQLNKKIEARYSIQIIYDYTTIATGLTGFNLSSHLGKIELDIEITNRDVVLIPAVELSQLTNRKFNIVILDTILQKSTIYEGITLESMSFDQHPPMNLNENFARTSRIQQLRFRQIDDALYRHEREAKEEMEQPRMDPRQVH